MYQQVARCDSGGSGAHRDDSIHLMWGYCGVLSAVDLYRLKFEVNNLKPFACLAFPQTTYLKTRQKQPIFGDELVTSFCRSTSPTLIFCKNGFGTGPDTQLTRVTASQDIVSRNEMLSAQAADPLVTLPSFSEPCCTRQTLVG